MKISMSVDHPRPPVAVEPPLELREISAGYEGVAVLERVTFSLEPDEFCAVVGPNGAGKSTLLRVIAGFLAPSSGSVLLGGRPVERLTPRERARRVAWLPQELPQGGGLTVLDAVLLGRYAHSRGYGAWPARDVAIARSALERMDILRLADHRLDSLSGGERQRVFLAQALCQEASLLLLDEPTNHLDPANQARLLKNLDELGVAVLLVTHELNLAARYARRLLLLTGGRIAVDGHPDEVVTGENLALAYGVSPPIVRHPESGRPQVLSL